MLSFNFSRVRQSLALLFALSLAFASRNGAAAAPTASNGLATNNRSTAHLINPSNLNDLRALHIGIAAGIPRQDFPGSGFGPRPYNQLFSHTPGLDVQAVLGTSANSANSVLVYEPIYPSYQYPNTNQIILVASNVQLTTSCLYATIAYGNFVPVFQVDNPCTGAHTNYTMNSTFVQTYSRPLQGSPFLSGVNYITLDVVEANGGSVDEVTLFNNSSFRYDVIQSYNKPNGVFPAGLVSGARLQEVPGPGLTGGVNCLNIPILQANGLLFSFVGGGSEGLNYSDGNVTPSGECFGDHVSPYDTFSVTNYGGDLGFQINPH